MGPLNLRLRTSLLPAAACLGLAALGCDDEPAPKPDQPSVVEGGKPESAAGKKVEAAKQEIEAVEKTMEKQDADRFERSAGEKVERGVP